MAIRVLSSVDGKESIARMQQVLNGPLTEQIAALNTEGSLLSDPNVWDGQLAEQFRGEWPSTKQTLDRAKEAIEVLRARAQSINTNIMSAGGNA